jgi:hypothetical protein
MLKNDSLILAQKALDKVFAATKKEVKNFKFVLDVSPRTLKTLVGNKADIARLDLIVGLGAKHTDSSSDFIALTSRTKLEKAKQILGKYTTKASGARELLHTRQEARGQFLLKKSSEAGTRLNKKVSKYFNDIGRITSPDLKSTLIKDIKSRKDSLEIELVKGFPTGNQYAKLVSQARRSLVSLPSLEKSNEVQELVADKRDLIIETVLGKVKKRNHSRKTTKTKKGRPVRKNAKSLPFFSFEPQGTSDHLNIMVVLNLYLSETIRNNHMGSLGDPYSPMYLRNVTGRFSESATVSHISPNNDIHIDYMQDPYSVFAPGGDMYSPGRSPINIIGGAVRELMQRHFTETRIGNIIQL